MPYLTSKDEKQQRTALIAVKLLQDTTLMVNLAVSDPKSPGARQALHEVAYNAPDENDRSPALDALRHIEFVPACPLQFDEPQNQPIDDLEQSCGMFGNSGAEATQNLAKNNFCATGPPRPITIAEMATKQAEVEKEQSIPFGNLYNHPLTSKPGPATDRKPLQDHGATAPPLRAPGRDTCS